MRSSATAPRWPRGKSGTAEMSAVAAAGVRYRLARPPAARAIGELVRRETRRWILVDQPASAAAPLLRGMTANAIRHKILDGQRFHLAWCEDGRLAGVAAMRGDCHLFQFFVSTRLHGRGIAGQLWRRAMRDAIRRAGTRCTASMQRAAIKPPIEKSRATSFRAILVTTGMQDLIR